MDGQGRFGSVISRPYAFLVWQHWGSKNALREDPCASYSLSKWPWKPDHTTMMGEHRESPPPTRTGTKRSGTQEVILGNSSRDRPSERSTASSVLGVTSETTWCRQCCCGLCPASVFPGPPGPQGPSRAINSKSIGHIWS